MSANSESSSIAPHTQYAHGRVRCRRCGTVVPADDVERSLCVHCQPDD